MQSRLLLSCAKVNICYFFAVLTAQIFTVIEVHDAMILWLIIFQLLDCFVLVVNSVSVGQHGI